MFLTFGPLKRRVDLLHGATIAAVLFGEELIEVVQGHLVVVDEAGVVVDLDRRAEDGMDLEVVYPQLEEE